MHPLRLLSTWILVVVAATRVCLADTSDPRSLYIEGYTGEVSYKPGDRVGLHVSTTARTFAVEIARVGARREVVLSTNGIPGQEYPVPENASAQGCGWGIFSASMSRRAGGVAITK